MELAVIWGNFSCSDVACSDLACSDLACSDLGHIIYQNSSLFTFAKFLGTHSAHIQMKQIQPNRTFIHCFTTISKNNCPISIFVIENDFSTQTLASPKNWVKIVKNQKLNAPSQMHIQNTTFHQHTSFTKFFYLLRYRDISTSTPHFLCTSKLDLVDLRSPKISNLTKSLLVHYPQPKMNQKSPKDPELIFSLTMKLLYTYFWKTLPAGALIWLAPIWLTWAQIMQPSSNHLKILNQRHNCINRGYSHGLRNWINSVSQPNVLKLVSVIRVQQHVEFVGFFFTGPNEMAKPRPCGLPTMAEFQLRKANCTALLSCRTRVLHYWWCDGSDPRFRSVESTRCRQQRQTNYAPQLDHDHSAHHQS